MNSIRFRGLVRSIVAVGPSSLRQSLIAVLTCLIASVPTIADDEAPSSSKAAAAEMQIDPDISELPDKLPDNRIIGFYHSQMDELIPDHFKPIPLPRLIEGIKKLAPTTDVDSHSRLSSAVYWIDIRDDLLISRRSEIDIESESKTMVWHSLGQVNFALEQPRNQDSSNGNDSLPRLENQPDGDLVAVLAPGNNKLSKVQFKWQRRGQSTGSGYSFDLQIPRTAQTRIVFSVPIGTKLEALDGVLRTRSGPPPDADTLVTGEKKRWFELDAGGLNRIRIQTLTRDSTRPVNPWILRNTSLQYLADATGLQWVCRMQLQPPEGGRFPVLQLRNTTVSKIGVNSFDMRFSSVARGVRRNIQIEVPESVLQNQSGLTTVTVSGTSTFRSNSNWFELPMPRWLGNVRVASTVDQIQLVVPNELQIARWDLPTNWSLRNPQSIDEGSMMYAASGPSPFQRLTSIGDRPADGIRKSPVWSRVRITQRPSTKSAETALRLESIDGVLTSRARLTVNTDPDGLAPFRVRVEPDWNVESLTFVKSGRVIEQPRVSRESRLVTIWPEAEDVTGGEIAVEVAGSRALDSEANRLTIPATWFVTPHNNVPTETITAIVRPANLNWSSNASVLPEKISESEIPDSTKSFFGALPRDTLVFRPQFGRTPVVFMETPVASFNTTTRFFVLRDRSDLIERLEVEIESSGPPLQQVVVHTGPRENRPPYQWSLTDPEESHRIWLPKSAVTVGTGNQDGVYTINLGDQTLRRHRLIGRRSFQSDDGQLVTLPTIPAATSSRSHAWIGPGLKIDEKAPDVNAILFDPNEETANFQMGGGLSTGEVDLQDAIGLRYQGSPSPTITISRSDRDMHVSIVRREQVRILASSRGVDRIEAIYWLAPSAKPIRIKYEPNLRLVSLYRNDSAVALRPSTSSQVTIPPRSTAETVRLTWNRDQYENLWIRKCSVPEISVSGIVLQSEYQLVPASDAFAPAALLHGLPTSSERYSAIDLQTGDVVTLIRRNVVLATGWLLAMLVFALSWLVARRNPLSLACMVVVVVTGLLLWWPWKLAVIGWFVVPMVAAGMLATSRARSAIQQPLDPTPGSADGHSGSSESPADASGDFSIQTVFRLLPWLFLIASVAGTTSVGQEPSSDNGITDSEPDQSVVPDIASLDSALQAINVLVPFGEDGKRIGKTVYVDESLYNEIVRPNDRAAPLDAKIQSARYHVRINPSRNNRLRTEPQIVEAEYLIHIDNETNQINEIRLPLAPSSIRRIELPDKGNQLIQKRADGPDAVIATLPRGNSFRIRLTLMLKATVSDEWNQLTISVPPVAASQLLVESDQEIDALRVGGPKGVVVKEAELRRWNDLIGPVDELLLEYRLDRELQDQRSNFLKRRYLVDAGQRSVSIDCQLDPPNTMAMGDSYQFIVRDDRKPVITSQHWKFEQSEPLVVPSLNRITVICTQDAPGSIHLHWTLPIESPINESSEQYSIDIPEVVATGSTETSDAWIGLRCDPALQFAPLIGDDIDSLSVDHFNAAWTGHRVSLDRAYLGVDVLPSPVVQYIPKAKPTLNRQHHLHVTADHCQLRFRATLEPNTSGQDLYCLRFPTELRLRELVVDGTSQPFQTIRYADYLEVPLRDLRNSESILIEVLADLPLSDQAFFSPPQINVAPATGVSDQYLISRDPSIAIRSQDQTTLESIALPDEIAVEWLKQGWSPALSFDLNLGSQDVDLRSDDDQETKIAPFGQGYRVETFSSSFGCQQLISISQQDDAWVMAASIRFDSEQMPDVIDVEAPSRWCDSLEVEGALQWLRLGDPDSPRQIIRIRYDKQSVSQRALTIRGRLIGIDTDRPSVPAIQVLGPGRRQVFIDVPSRSPSGESILWQTVAVDAAPLPQRLSNSESASVKDRSTFVASNPAWSIELAALPENNVDPIAYLFDGNVFSQPDGALIHCRWDLFPGSLDSVDIQLRNDTTVLAAWCAGRAVQAHRIVDIASTTESQNQTVRVPLSVGRLPQSVEILLRVSPKAAKHGQYVPELVGIPVTRKWLVHYVPKYQSAQQELTQAALSFPSSQAGSLSALTHQRQVSLAASILDSLESVDRTASQPLQEIAALVQDWLLRYQRVREQARPEEATESIRSQWQQIDLQLTQLFQRYGFDPDDPTTVGDEQPSLLNRVADSDFANSETNGFQVERITALTATDEAHAVVSNSATDRGLRTLIVNGLTIALVIGLLACLIPVYRFVAPVTGHPAFWLAMMGIFGFAIAPIGVAGAMLLLAIALPAFPAKRPVSDLVG